MSARVQTGDSPEPDAENTQLLSGIALILWEIDVETLPEPGAGDAEAVRRRVAAAREGRDGWRTGELATTLDDYADAEER